MKWKIKLKLVYLSFILLTIVFNLTASDSIPRHYFNHNIYLDYNQQFSFIPAGQIEKDVMAYLKIDRNHLTLAFCPEAGTFIGEKIKIGVFFRSEEGNTKKERDEPVLFGSNVFYTLYKSTSIGIRCRYYVIDNDKLRVPVGIAFDYSNQIFVIDNMVIDARGPFNGGIFSANSNNFGVATEAWTNYYFFKWLYVGAGFALKYSNYFKINYRNFDEYWFQVAPNFNKPDLDIFAGALNIQIGMQF